jgi:predicted nucleotidyltransferase
MNKFGITEQSFNYIIESLGLYKEIEKTIIFGSRSIGNYKKGSDIDLSIIGENVTDKTVLSLSTKLNQELPIPYYFDIINYQTIDNIQLQEHIDQFGSEIYNTKV